MGPARDLDGISVTDQPEHLASGFNRGDGVQDVGMHIGKCGLELTLPNAGRMSGSVLGDIGVELTNDIAHHLVGISDPSSQAIVGIAEQRIAPVAFGYPQVVPGVGSGGVDVLQTDQGVEQVEDDCVVIGEIGFDGMPPRGAVAVNPCGEAPSEWGRA